MKSRYINFLNSDWGRGGQGRWRQNIRGHKQIIAIFINLSKSVIFYKISHRRWDKEPLT
jgi:hypothetical protein